MDGQETVIVLEDENGEEVPCRQLDRIEYRNESYVILSPLDEDDSVMIYRVKVDGDGVESFDPEVDEQTNEDVFDYFRAAWDEYEFCEAE